MKKEFFFICSALFLIVFGTYLSGQVLVPYTTALGGTSFTIGIVSGSMYVVRLIFSAPIGRLSHKKGPKTILIYSLLLYPVIALAYYISWDIPSYIAARLLHGFASAMMLPMAMAYVGEISPPGQEGRYMGIYNTVFYVASAAGPIAGGFIYDTYGAKAAFLSLFAFALFSLAFILAAPRDKKQPSAVKPAAPVNNTAMSFSGLMKNRSFLALLFMSVISAILMALLGASFVQLLLQRHLKMSLIGLMSALFYLVIGVIQVPFGRFTDRFGKTKLMLISGVLTAAIVMSLPLFGNLWSIAALIFTLGVFLALNISVFSAISALFGKKAGMSGTMGALGSANSAGSIIGYLALGRLTDSLGISTTFYITGVLFLAGVILFAILGFRKEVSTRKSS